MRPLEPDDPTDIGGYRLRGRLGAGGMGAVYLAHTPAGRPVALKVIRHEYAQDAEFRRRFAQEARSARRVHGLYTAQLLDSDVEGEQPWLASAYVPGPSLTAAVAQYGPLPLRTVLQLAAGVAEALTAIHAEGIVHRDLKPSNVLLAEDGPRVIDFGIARALDATALTSPEVRLGTPGFMAPEQIQAGGLPGPPVDVFALGLLAHYAATGQHPFGEGSSEVLLYRIVVEEPDLAGTPAELRGLIARCLAKDPAARPVPAQIVELCRVAAGGELYEDHGRGWLAGLGGTPPAAPAPVPPGSPPPAPVPPDSPPPAPVPPDSPPPAQPPTAAPSFGPPPAYTPTAPPPAPVRPRRRAPRVAASVAGALLVIAGSVFAVDRFSGDDDGGDGKGGGAPGDIVVAGKPVTGHTRSKDTRPQFAYRRTYTDGPLYAAVTGHRSNAFGTSGLEGVYADELAAGGTVLTTIEPKAQRAALKGLGAHRGAVVALDPATGKIVALASAPSYDPGRFAGTGKADRAVWQELTGDKGKPMLNRALRQTYPPGFTFSLVTAATALREGFVPDAASPTDSPEPYTLPLSTVQLRNPVAGQCANASLTTALTYSCSTVLARLSDGLGNGSLRSAAADFGFGKETPVPVRAAESVFPEESSRPQNAMAGIGQGNTQVTPLQMAMVAGAVAGDGTVRRPGCVSQVRRADGSVADRFKATRLGSPLDPGQASELRGALESAVEQTGSAARVAGARVGGVTGTAQSGVGSGEDRAYLWFVGYARQPDGDAVAVAVVVQSEDAPRDLKDTDPAARIAADVMEAALGS
ncbi:penicillin-binding transpeptidase domain-containing protein [Streptomyces sp. NPDC051940]|uniref:penicillin-binding transpeptidase domain-containing protein n=1 Tax=Streptomyces sp. NPDC051940 TaxID=3155675 RepID=UPI00341B7DF5